MEFWKDRIVEFPRRYKLQVVDEAQHIYDLVPVTGVVTEEGTPVNATNLEQGILSFAQANIFIATGSYTGNGTNNRHIEIGEEASFVFVGSGSGRRGMGITFNPSGFGLGLATGNFDYLVPRGEGSDVIPTINSSGFTVSSSGNVVNSDLSLNHNGRNYQWWALIIKYI